METITRFVSAKFCFVLGFLLSWSVRHVYSLSIKVVEVECVSELVLHEGDIISGNFVVVDHEIFWNSEHPGIDFSVSSTCINVCNFFSSNFPNCIFGDYGFVLWTCSKSAWKSWFRDSEGNWISSMAGYIAIRIPELLIVICELTLMMSKVNRFFFKQNKNVITPKSNVTSLFESLTLKTF